MKPFKDYELRNVLGNQYKAINEKIDKLSNEEVMANDLDVLTDNLYQEFYIEPVTVEEEDFEKRSIAQGKIRKYIDPFFRTAYDKEYVDVDGIIASFFYPYSGEDVLFKCQASIFSLGGYPEISLQNGYLIIKAERALNEMNDDGAKDRLLAAVKSELDDVKQGLGYANSDVNAFNNGLKRYISDAITTRKSKVQSFYNIAQMFEVPIEKKEYAKKHIPLERKIVPIAHKYDSESYYNVSDSDYKDVLDTLKHTLSTYERTPESYKSMQEEDLRNTLLATLNATYKGTATGETFRRKGKTDICIEQENRAAFVAECKIWKGAKALTDAVDQLDGYLTWRDCKTALIVFVRQKDFIKVLEKAKDALNNLENMRSLRELDKNEFECVYISNSHPGQLVKMRVMLFDLSYDE